jgi:peroxiredoxin
MKWRSLEASAENTDLRPLREIYAERKALIDRYVPEEVRAIHARVVAELKQWHLSPLPSGSRMPDFELKDHNNQMVSSGLLLNKGPVVICFIRGRWCPFCVGQVEAMNLIADEIRDLDASLIAISPQTVQQSFFMADQHKLRFPLLSDPQNEVARKTGLVYRVPEYQQSIYKRAFVNLPFANGDDSWELPIPATFIADRDRSVLYASANPDYTDRPEPAEILQALTSFSHQAGQNPPVR